MVYLNGEFINGDLLKVSAVIQNIKDNVLGTAFRLKYDEKLDFLRYEPGDFLEAGGDPFYLVKNEENVQEIVFGQTLRREDDYPIGSGKLVDFYFQIKEEGEFNFYFEKGVVSTWDTVRQDLSEIEWKSFKVKRPQEEKMVFNSMDEATNVLARKFPIEIATWWVLGVLILGAAFFLIKKVGKKRA